MSKEFVFDARKFARFKGAGDIVQPTVFAGGRKAHALFHAGFDGLSSQEYFKGTAGGIAGQRVGGFRHDLHIVGGTAGPAVTAVCHFHIRLVGLLEGSKGNSFRIGEGVVDSADLRHLVERGGTVVLTEVLLFNGGANEDRKEE